MHNQDTEKKTEMERLAILKEAIMEKDKEEMRDPSLFIREVEERMDEFFSSRRSEIEKELQERIEREKREAEKRIEDVGREFGRIRTALEEHRNAIAGLQANRDGIYEKIRRHFQEARSRRVSAAAALREASGELEAVSELKKELRAITEKAEQETAALRSCLEGFGVKLELPGLAVAEDPAPDYEEELTRITNIRNILGVDVGTDEPEVRTPAEPAPPAAEQPRAEEPVSPAAAEPAAEAGRTFGMREEFRQAEEPTVEPETEPTQPAPQPAEKAKGQADEAGPLLEKLKGMARTESAGNGTTVTFYEGPRGKVIDVVSLLRAMDEVIEQADELHKQLAGTTSIKDLFLTKQEILNKQEVLRKAFYLGVKFCEKDGGEVPAFVTDVFDVEAMKDALERLTLGNWSDLADFKLFSTDAVGIFGELRKRLWSLPAYLQSIIDRI